MNTILTDDERREIHRKAAFAPSAVDALIAETEAAVLAKLREQTPQPAHAPGYCKHCKQYTIEEPLAPQAEQAADRQPEVPAQWQEAVKVAREALDGMLQVHGVTQNDAIRHDTIPTSWVELSDEARAALTQLDGLGTASTERQPLTDERILAFVKAAPALDTAEAEWLHVARAIERAHGIVGKEQG